MKTYRNVNFEVVGTLIKFHHTLSERRIAGEVYKNGEKYITIPKEFSKCPELYARRIIDRTYDWAAYHKNFEERHLKGQSTRGML